MTQCIASDRGGAREETPAGGAPPGALSAGNGLPPLMRAIPDCIFRMSREGRYLDCSIPEGAVTYAAPEAFLGRRVDEVLPPAQASACLRAIEEACVTRRPQSYQYCTGADGEYDSARWYDVRVVALDTGEVLCLVRNVTSERQAEAEARRLSGAARQLSLLFRQTAFGMIEWSLDLRVSQWNPGAERLFGLTHQQAIGKRGVDVVFVSADREAAERELREAIDRREGTVVRRSSRRPDGRMVFAEWHHTPLVDESDEVIGVASIVQDLTDGVRAEEIIERDRRLFVSGPVIGIRWLPLPGWPVEFVTQNISRFGYSPEQFARQELSYTDLVHPEDLARITSELSELVSSGGASLQQQYRFRTASGEYRWLEDSTVVVRDGQGQVVHLDGFISDATQRVAAEQELKLSRERYELLVNTIEGIVWEGDPETFRFTFMSRQAEWILGIPAERFLTEPGLWASRLHPEDREWTREYCMEQTRLKRDHQLEFRMIDADGSTVWLRDYVTVVDEGMKVYVRGIMVDITKLKNAETALAYSREQLERAQTVAHIGSWSWDLLPSDRLVWSHETFRIFGVDEAMFTGRVDFFLRMVFPDDLSAVQKASNAALAGGPRYSVDHRIVRADGVVRWVHQEADIVWNSDGTPRQMIGVVQDITDRRAALEALRASEARFRRVAESNLIGLYFWDSHGGITESNRVFTEMLGFTSRDPLPASITWRELTPAECRANDDEAIAELRRNGSCRPYAKELIRRDGSRIPVLVGMAYLDDTRRDGVCFVLDITERKHAERWQAFMMAELDHRVKNNMAAVLTLAEQTIRSDMQPQESGRVLLGRLRALARTHGALAHTHWQGARLLPLVQHTMEAFRSADAPNVFIEGDDVLLPPRVATVMSMALHELATNALKYGALSAPKGVVHISWRTQRVSESARSLHVHWRESGGPAVTTPVRRGFGRELIEGGVAYECSGTVKLSFLEGGVECLIELPLTDPSQQPIIVKPADISPRRL